jgi:hypothetical protein
VGGEPAESASKRGRKTAGRVWKEGEKVEDMFKEGKPVEVSQHDGKPRRAEVIKVNNDDTIDVRYLPDEGEEKGVERDRVREWGVGNEDLQRERGSTTWLMREVFMTTGKFSPEQLQPDKRNMFLERRCERLLEEELKPEQKKYLKIIDNATELGVEFNTGNEEFKHLLGSSLKSY